MLVTCLAAICAGAVPVAPAFGEGSVDFNTGPDTRFRNQLQMSGTPQPPVGVFYTVLRVYARAGETIQLGSSVMGLAGGVDNIRVYAPGTDFASATDASEPADFPEDPVFETEVFDCNTDDPGTGRIASRAEELAGPAPNPGGFTPCEYVAPADGIYAVIMYPYDYAGANATSRIGTPLTTTLQGRGISLWDVTVRDSGNVVQPGRLFSHHFVFLEGSVVSPANAPSPVSYFYTPAGYEYRVSFFQHAGANWVLAADGQGVVDAATGQRLFASFADVQTFSDARAPLVSGPDLTMDSRYPVSVRRLDPLVITGNGGLAQTRGFAAAPMASASVIQSLSFTGADGAQGATAQGSGGTIRVGSAGQMDGLGYTVELDLNSNGSFGDAGDVVGRGNLSATAGNSFAWDGRDASGATPACGSYSYRARATPGEAHLTQYDVERSAGTQIERLSLPSDPGLGDPLTASYNDVDPYRGTAVTNSSPGAVSDGISGSTFHSWTTGPNAAYVDTWMRLPEVVASGSFRVLCPGEVSVDKRASDGRVVVGDTVTYRLVAKNNSAGQADGVVVEDRVPSKLDVRSASSTQGDCTVSGNRVRCEIGTLASGAEATVTVRAVAVEAGQSTNTGIVVAERCPQAQCDTDPAKVTIVKPKLRVAKTAAKARVRAGGLVSYTIRVTNPSKRVVRNVRTCDHLPAGLVAVKASSKVKVSEGRYCWTAKRIGVGKSKSYELTVRTLPGAAGRTVNRATASSAGVRDTARAARAVRVLPRQAAGGGVTG